MNIFDKAASIKSVLADHNLMNKDASGKVLKDGRGIKVSYPLPKGKEIIIKLDGSIEAPKEILEILSDLGM